MNGDQPNTTPMTELDRYYEALYMARISKPGSEQERYWTRKSEDLEWVTKLQERH